MLRTCRSCGEEKSLRSFGRSGGRYLFKCKVCRNACDRRYRKKQPRELVKARKQAEYLKNRAAYIARAKKYAADNPIKVATYKQRWSEENAEHKAALGRCWRQANAHRIILHSNKRAKRKREAAPKWL